MTTLTLTFAPADGAAVRPNVDGTCELDSRCAFVQIELHEAQYTLDSVEAIRTALDNGRGAVSRPMHIDLSPDAYTLTLLDKNKKELASTRLGQDEDFPVDYRVCMNTFVRRIIVFVGGRNFPLRHLDLQSLLDSTVVAA